jgi:MFS family permease
MDGCYLSRDSHDYLRTEHCPVVLVLYLKSIGLTESQTGVLLTVTLIGDTLVSLWLTTRADRIGRRRVLRIGALLMTPRL